MKCVWTIAMLAMIILVGCTSNPEAAARVEADEDLEESIGDEAELVGDDPDDMDDWFSPGGEVEAEMEAEPYPE